LPTYQDFILWHRVVISDNKYFSTLGKVFNQNIAANPTRTLCARPKGWSSLNDVWNKEVFWDNEKISYFEVQFIIVEKEKIGIIVFLKSANHCVISTINHFPDPS